MIFQANYITFQGASFWMAPKKSNPRIPRKKGQRAMSKKHSDLYTDENPKGTIKKLGFKKGDFPVAENYGKRAISLPLYFDLKT